MSDVYIKLDVYRTAPLKMLGRESARVRIEAKNGVGLPNEIFLYKREVFNPTTQEEADTFQGISTLFYISTTPVDTPPVTRNPPFFRKSYVDIILPNATAADEAVAEIEAEVARLINDAKRELAVVKQNSSWLGDVPDCPDDVVCLGADDTYIVTEDISFSFLGQNNETATLYIDGVAKIIGNFDDALVFDVDGDDEYTFVTVGETITVTINSRDYNITWDGVGSLLFSIDVSPFGSIGSI